MARAIYKITNIINGKFYVGSSINTRDRFKQHKRLLKRDAHHSRYLQNSWNKYGKEAFVFHVIEIIPEWESLEDAEDVWLKEHVGEDHCYNVGTSAASPTRGTKFSAETCKKLSEALKGNQCAKGYKRTDEEKEAIRQRTLGNQNFLGKTHSDESRAKMGKALVELTTGKEFAVMNDAVKFYGMPNLTQILRQMESDIPIAKGKNQGLFFVYKGSGVELPSIAEEFKDYPTSRPKAIKA